MNDETKKFIEMAKILIEAPLELSEEGKKVIDANRKSAMECAEFFGGRIVEES